MTERMDATSAAVSVAMVLAGAAQALAIKRILRHATPLHPDRLP